MHIDSYDYSFLVSKLLEVIPEEELEEVLGQDYCEYELSPADCDDPGNLGFLTDYAPLANLIPTSHTVIDLGCYVAPQAYFFKDHKAYIGVDVCGMDDMPCSKRFTPDNATHYDSSIQDFIQNFPEYLGHNKNVTAICNAVPDRGAQALVRESFGNHFVKYPEMRLNDVTSPSNPLLFVS